MQLQRNVSVTCNSFNSISFRTTSTLQSIYKFIAYYFFPLHIF